MTHGDGIHYASYMPHMPQPSLRGCRNLGLWWGGCRQPGARPGRCIEPRLEELAAGDTQSDRRGDHGQRQKFTSREEFQVCGENKARTWHLAVPDSRTNKRLTRCRKQES